MYIAVSDGVGDCFVGDELPSFINGLEPFNPEKTADAILKRALTISERLRAVAPRTAALCNRRYFGRQPKSLTTKPSLITFPQVNKAIKNSEADAAILHRHSLRLRFSRKAKKHKCVFVFIIVLEIRRSTKIALSHHFPASE